MRDRPDLPRNVISRLDEQIRQSRSAEDESRFVAVDQLVLRMVGDNPGFPHDQLAFNIFEELTRTVTLPSEAATIAVVRQRLHALAEKGQLSELTVADQSGKRRQLLYFPSGYKFSHVPANTVFGGKEPAGLSVVVQPERAKILEGVGYIVESVLQGHERLRLVRMFCDRCGAKADGHWCNE